MSDIWQLTVLCNLVYRTFYWTCPINHGVDFERKAGSGHGSGHEITYDCPDRVKGIDKRVYLDKMIIVSKITDNLTVMSDKKIKLVMIQ